MKEHHSILQNQLLRVILLQIDASLQGARSCLPDFHPQQGDAKHDGEKYSTSYISGASGVCIGSTELREESADVVDFACK